MADDLVKMGYIPLDKSWTMRMGVLDLIKGRDTTVKFIEERLDAVNDDIRSLYTASVDWNCYNPVHVGESGTLYRFLKFTAWKTGQEKDFVMSGTLKSRKLCDDPAIVNYPLHALGNVDGHYTTQWISAAIINGSAERLERPGYKIHLTYEAVDDHAYSLAKGKHWVPKYDETINRQAKSFIDGIRNGSVSFTPRHSEDYCFARAMDKVSKNEGDFRWPNLKNHETNRLEEMEIMIEKSDQGMVVDSVDHRVVQAIAMRQMVRGQDVKVRDRTVVNKSWPEFWKFLDYARDVYRQRK